MPSNTNQLTCDDDLTLNHDSWNVENMTTTKCKHCKKYLCKIEVAICKKGWNSLHHYCCYVCYQENDMTDSKDKKVIKDKYGNIYNFDATSSSLRVTDDCTFTPKSKDKNKTWWTFP